MACQDKNVTLTHQNMASLKDILVNSEWYSTELRNLYISKRLVHSRHSLHHLRTCLTHHPYEFIFLEDPVFSTAALHSNVEMCKQQCALVQSSTLKELNWPSCQMSVKTAMKELQKKMISQEWRKDSGFTFIRQQFQGRPVHTVPWYFPVHHKTTFLTEPTQLVRK